MNMLYVCIFTSQKYDEQLTDIKQVKLALGVAKGMDYLAEVGYVHRVSWKDAAVTTCVDQHVI